MAKVEYKPGKLQPDVAEAYDCANVTVITTKVPFRRRVDLAALDKKTVDAMVKSGELEDIFIPKPKKESTGPKKAEKESHKK